LSEENHLREELLFWRCEHHIVAAERDRLRTRLEQAEKERDGYIQKSDDLNRVVMKRGKQIDELVEALKEAEEEIRQSKFRYESITPEIGFGEINQWIHSRDVALLHVRNTLAAFEGLSNENQFVW
jgi:chromosome segregation ATPase